ncbi:hypothetical protein IV203_004500 [Nitzschia inconspicua]|uniref:Uncharacterized protein n=1 Tax=Nitzschia inconspicua TaxID=303405 RepID=A0A9K3L3U6_9STRA|nr:hypothetical protein IV203_004500 [Nitzschia inconspicua]
MHSGEDHEPRVGALYNGSKVVDVKVDISDRGTRVRQRSTIKLENGAILIKDHIKDKKFEEVDTKRRRAPPRTKSGDSVGPPQRLLPKTKSGRHLPKPVTGRSVPLRAESPARCEGGRRRSSSRGRDVIVCNAPDERQKVDGHTVVVSSSRHNPRVLQGGHNGIPMVPMTPERNKKNVSVIDLSPEPSDAKKRSSLRNLSHFLASPNRKRPTCTKSGSDLEAMRDSLHSCSSKPSSGEMNEDVAPKPGSLKSLGKLIHKTKVQKSKSGDDLELMRAEVKKEPQRHARKSTATAESNKEKLKSFKEMIAASNKTSKSKSAPEDKGRRSSLQSEILHNTPRITRRSLGSQPVESPPRNSSPPREPSLSPEEIKKPISTPRTSASSYVTGFLDKLYDSYINDGDCDGSDDDSDAGGRKPTSFLDLSLTKFVDWAE